MRKQQKIWEDGHSKAISLPSMEDLEPSSNLKKFLEFLKTKIGLKGLKGIDIGCGNGRNSAYLAKNGIEMYGIDYINSAIIRATQLAKQSEVSDNTHFALGEIDKKWDFSDNFFDIALDCYSSIDIETEEGRNVYKNELFRTLKPFGYGLITVVSTEDEFEKEVLKNSPGKEKNSTMWSNGKFQKDYDEIELKEFYKEFSIIQFETLRKPAKKLGRNYTAENFYMIIQKPTR